MQFIYETPLLEAYLAEQANVDYSHPLIQETLKNFSMADSSEVERIKKTYEFVRDEVHHSMDVQGVRVTCAASEVLRYREGLCYAKSHLLAALLRAQGIPTGFCYQRLLLGLTPAEGYALHGLNAVYLSSEERWIRLDARGNKPGIDARFSTHEEHLAYAVQPELGEIDYPTIYAQPHPIVIQALQAEYNCADLPLPDSLSDNAVISL
ncbi:Cro/Cl family transcriptional regulator [Reticulibacter mediterranei]|uniref:Cro/Cl family transcriptional regulator n=1 Tax=Reticulibacter mediterranei TaxID=2778369 RepID=A0A8J3IU95_9CHLR|nr:transglutaminase family protein [Reticulibacter mediterranei]GHP00962.1 Cro/Cl family transcriptional regulator [Reticulibacter mediterranei]